MKNQRLLGILIMLLSGFFFVQCTSDPIPGPAGQDGIDGIDGVDGQDGVDGTASCISCHSNTAREPIFASFELSGHGSGSTGFAAGRGGDDPTNRCAQCHGEEGFIDFIVNGESNVDGYANASTIYCSTCHSSHETFDFATDGQDYALINDYAQALLLDPSITIDFEGSSNNCITCHQPRTSYVIPAEDGTGKYVVTSSRFGPHHGPQATMLEGVLGAPIPGSTGYPGVGSATHRTGSSCVQCHMTESSMADVGGHSWVPGESACLTCHTNGAPSELGGYSSGMATLKQLLTEVVGEMYAVDSLGNPVYDVDGNPVGTGDPVVGIIIDLAPDDTDRSNTGIFTVQEAQAAWNYMTLLEDQSHGIHNPGYSRALLQNSIEALQN